MNGNRKKTGAVAAALAAIVALALVTAVTAGASSGKRTATTPAAVIASAKKIIAEGQKGLLHNTVAEPTISSNSAFEVVKGWPGPKSTPTPPKGKKLEIIVCLFGTACEVSGRAAEEAAKLLGWQVEVIDGKGSPAGYFTALDTALSKKPDAILTMAIPESQIADKIAKAHSQKIPVLGIASIPEKASKDHYDAYVSFHEISGSVMQANYVIADSNGTAKVVYLWDFGYPHLVAAIEASKRILAKCTGCTILETKKRELATAIDPVAMGKITTALVGKYGKDLQYILTPYGTGVAPVIEALRAAGRSDVKVLSNNAEKQNLAFVAKGQQAEDNGQSIQWSGWAAIDQTIRLLSGQKALPDFGEGVSIKVFTKANAPASGNFDWTKVIDYVGQYKKLWGLK